MVRDYDWDLESPIDDPLSVDRTTRPKYDSELGDLYRIMRVPPSVDIDSYPSRDSREIKEWEKMVEVAAYQFEVVPDIVETDQNQAERMFETGELLVYKLLDDFDDFHVNYYDQFMSERDAVSVGNLRDAYRDAHD